MWLLGLVSSHEISKIACVRNTHGTYLQRSGRAILRLHGILCEWDPLCGLHNSCVTAPGQPQCRTWRALHKGETPPPPRFHVGFPKPTGILSRPTPPQPSLSPHDIAPPVPP